MKKLLTTLTLLFLTLGTAWGGAREDGFAAAESKDYATAFKLWRPLAEQGDAVAQSNLGVMYRTGQGVLQDYARAHMWLNLASAAGGSKYGTENRDILANKMTPQQIEKAQGMAKACQASNFKGC